MQQVPGGMCVWGGGMLLWRGDVYYGVFMCLLWTIHTCNTTMQYTCTSTNKKKKKNNNNNNNPHHHTLPPPTHTCLSTVTPSRLHTHCSRCTNLSGTTLRNLNSLAASRIGRSAGAYTSLHTHMTGRRRVGGGRRLRVVGAGVLGSASAVVVPVGG